MKVTKSEDNLLEFDNGLIVAANVETIAFEPLHKYIAMMIDGIELAAAKDLQLHVENRIDYLGTQIVADWKELAHKIHEDKETAYWYKKFPATWWQMLKKDKAPKWFVQRYPVQYRQYKSRRTVTFTRYATYPMANMKIDRNSKIFIQNLGGVERIEDKVA